MSRVADGSEGLAQISQTLGLAGCRARRHVHDPAETDEKREPLGEGEAPQLPRGPALRLQIPAQEVNPYLEEAGAGDCERMVEGRGAIDRLASAGERAVRIAEPLQRPRRQRLRPHGFVRPECRDPHRGAGDVTVDAYRRLGVLQRDAIPSLMVVDHALLSMRHRNVRVVRRSVGGVAGPHRASSRGPSIRLPLGLSPRREGARRLSHPVERCLRSRRPSASALP